MDKNQKRKQKHIKIGKYIKRCKLESQALCMPSRGPKETDFCTIHGRLDSGPCECQDSSAPSYTITKLQSIHFVVMFTDGRIYTHGCASSEAMAKAMSRKLKNESRNTRYRWDRAEVFPLSRHIEEVTCGLCRGMIRKAGYQFRPKYCQECGSIMGVDCGDAEPDYNEDFCSVGCWASHGGE